MLEPMITVLIESKKSGIDKDQFKCRYFGHVFLANLGLDRQAIPSIKNNMDHVTWSGLSLSFERIYRRSHR